MSRVLTWIALAALACLVVVLAVQNRTLRNANAGLEQRLALTTSGPEVGALAPAMSITTADGQTVKIGGADGATTVLYFFSTQCPYCRASLPQVHRIADSGVRLLGIALRPYDEVDAYAKKHKLDFPIASDRSGEISDRYGVKATPLLLVVDGKGAVAFKHVGQLDDLTASNALEGSGLGATIP